MTPVTVFAFVLAFAAPAPAAYITSNSGGAYIRAKPWKEAMAYGYFGNGTWVNLYCWIDGGWAQGNWWTNRWYRTNVPSYRYGSPEAYIHVSLVTQHWTPRC